MERKAHYALIGLVSILSFASLVVFIIWLAGAQVARRFDVYDVSFKGPVRGLSTGGEVFFNGIRIGEVRIKYILRCVSVATAFSGEMCWVRNGTFCEALFSTYGNDCS